MDTTQQLNQIDIIMPTMWMVDGVADNLARYCENPHIGRVILIDNNPAKRPDHAVFSHDKMEYVTYGHNIYVNPAWNEGYYRSRSPVLCILNDDISVADEIWTFMAGQDYSQIDVVGVNLKGGADNYTIDQFEDDTDRLVRLNYDRTQPIGGQAWAFGICMFIKRTSYHVIPGLYQVWYGDDYLVQRNQNIYVLMTNRITGMISGTLSQHDANTDLKRRVVLDSINAYRYNHFTNSQDWDILKHNRYLDKWDMDIMLDIEYDWARRNPSDINENVHLLYDLGRHCKTAIEMGVRTGVSSRALLHSGVSLVSYDINVNPDVARLFELARKLGQQAQYHQADVLKISIPKVDLLFIDTYHTYEQLRQELKLHGNQAQKYLAFHDTYTFGLTGENPQDRRGLLTAIIEFMIQNPHWKWHTFRTNNNGFTILERIST